MEVGGSMACGPPLECLSCALAPGLACPSPPALGSLCPLFCWAPLSGPIPHVSAQVHSWVIRSSSPHLSVPTWETQIGTLSSASCQLVRRIRQWCGIKC